MTRFRPRGLSVVAIIFVVTGLGLMLASLQVESSRAPSVDATEAEDIVIPTAAAVAASSAVTPQAGDPKAERAFARAQTASRTVAYGGVKEISRWVNGAATTTLVGIQHVPGRGTVVQTNSANNPQAVNSTLTVEPDATSDSAALKALLGNYQLVAGPGADVLGRKVDTVEAFRADGSVAARFWIDQQTGVVLRRELLDSANQTVEAAAYVNVRFGASAAVATPAATAADAWSVVDATGVDALRADGWVVPEALGGGLKLYQVRSQDEGDDRTVQLAYTDGLFGVSVFLQQGVLDRSAMSGYVPVTVGGGEVWARSGSTFYTWHARPAVDGGTASRDVVVSALADSPNAPAGAAFAAFPPLPADDSGVGDHVTRGVHRVGSWFDPQG